MTIFDKVKENGFAFSNKYVIIERVKMYGNNFPTMSKLINKEMKNLDIPDKDLALLLGYLKQSRIMNYVNDGEIYSENDLQNVMVSSNKNIDGLVDSLTDRDNYFWIYENYDEYLKGE